MHHSKPSASRLAVALAALVAAGSALAQTSGTTAAPGATSPATSASAAASRLAREDASFLKQAAQNGHTEVEGSKLAATKATTEPVKTFAQKMVDDHTKTNTELAALASSKGVDVPTEPSVAQKAKLKLLSAADGADFDRRYADMLGVKAHEDTIKLFQKAASGAKDPEVKAFAEKTLPALKEHLEMARKLKAGAPKKS
ncbi:DUF4142 domain-containing protein [Rhizobacter sp. LjRoot28]|uniref:DUF4142 domain-containing protein n=1 Tax=Rhizobacter sp. LjRoot28 TaxID=3342309 RepID=UPI003ECEC807